MEFFRSKTMLCDTSVSFLTAPNRTTSTISGKDYIADEFRVGRIDLHKILVRVNLAKRIKVDGYLQKTQDKIMLTKVMLTQKILYEEERKRIY